MKTKSKLTVKIAKDILNILQSKDECKSTFQLNKYIFFVTVVASVDSFNSHEIYKLIKVDNNAHGAAIKQNLIDWGIIEKLHGVHYQQEQSTGRFLAANNSRYKISPKFMFSKKTEYDLISDKAKFINHASVFDLTNGLIVEIYKEVKQRKPRAQKVTQEASSTVTETITSTTNITTLSGFNYVINSTNVAEDVADFLKMNVSKKTNFYQYNNMAFMVVKDEIKLLKSS